MTVPGSRRHPRPVARSDDLVISRNGDEVLVYDQKLHRIHYLNAVSAATWQACDGAHEAGDLAACASAATDQPVSLETVRLALAQLDEADLLEAPLAPALKPVRQTRRSLLRKAGAAAAIPAIVSVSAPSAAVALSGCVPTEDCESEAQCCIRDDVDLFGCCTRFEESWACGPTIDDPGQCVV